MCAAMTTMTGPKQNFSQLQDDIKPVKLCQANTGRYKLNVQQELSDKYGDYPVTPSVKTILKKKTNKKKTSTSYRHKTGLSGQTNVSTHLMLHDQAELVWWVFIPAKPAEGVNVPGGSQTGWMAD